MILSARKKRDALYALTAGRLRELVDALFLFVRDHRRREGLVNCLADGRRVEFEQVLALLNRDELKSMCIMLGLNDNGRAKKVIIDRILSLGQKPRKESHRRKRSARQEPSAIRQPKSVHISDHWNGYSPVAPKRADFHLTRRGGEFDGTANFAVGCPACKATQSITIPMERVRRFLDALARANLTEGEYHPRLTHTDDHPSISIRLDFGKGNLEFFTQSQGMHHVPWGLHCGDRTYVIQSATVAKALKSLDRYLRREILEDLVKSAMSAKAIRYLNRHRHRNVSLGRDMSTATDEGAAKEGAHKVIPTTTVNRQSTPINPSVGMLATVRNRRGVISSVAPFDGHEGRLHLVTVEYTDGEGVLEDQLIWEREPRATLVPPSFLPQVSTEDPMPGEDFDALVRATRWTAISPFLDPDGSDGPLDRFPVSSPLHGAIQIEDFQMVPLLKALRMPRVSLLIADDVGLGKTIEAGLVLSELIIRRRVRRVLILCPASLKSQWRQEMHEKFSLAFDEIDRDNTHALRKNMGLDANPWRVFPRVIASYYYLRQPDIRDEFLAASRSPEGSPHLPWDLLIVDEAHNLSPASFGEDSDLSKMLGFIAPHFEHKIFLTATPHNGHTRSFTGLLELLDPVRFTRSTRLEGAARVRVEDVLVRRLKSEINTVTNPPRFCERQPVAIQLKLSPEEKALSEAFDEFRRKVRSLIAQSRRTEQLAGSFAVEILGKRLLSCPATFADSWHRYMKGASEEEEANADEVRAAERAAREEIDDDVEAEGRVAHAARTVGAWLKPLADRLRPEVEAIEQALRGLDLHHRDMDPTERRPSGDSRFDALTAKIESLLRDGGKWRNDERLIIFTEYKTTLDYLDRRLSEAYPDDGVIRLLYGSQEMERKERERVKRAFNDPKDPVRILVATDAASEGLNLQESARYLLHYDVPWNPSRIEQRNGRLDRHGQARDVTAFHFESDDDADLKFLSYVVGKVHTIREDLGSVGDVFDTALQRRLVFGESADTVRQEIEKAVEAARGRADIPRDHTGPGEVKQLDSLRAELDLSPDALRDTLESALSADMARPRLTAPDSRGRVMLAQPIPPRWTDLVDDTLRIGDAAAKGALPGLVFSPDHFVQRHNGRPIFRPEPDTTLLHLGHPIYQRVLTSFARLRFPGADAGQKATRWTVRRGEVPDGASALIVLTVEELAVNELRESFHHWVRSLRIPVLQEALGDVLPHAPAIRISCASAAPTQADVNRARDLWDEVEDDLRELLDRMAKDLTTQITDALQTEFENARKEASDRFTSRQNEITALLRAQSMARLEHEIDEIEAELRQGTLFDRDGLVRSLTQLRDAKEEELKRRQTHFVELREQLAAERDRVLERLLPGRYTLRAQAQCFPVAVEIRLPEAS